MCDDVSFNIHCSEIDRDDDYKEKKYIFDSRMSDNNSNNNNIKITTKIIKASFKSRLQQNAINFTSFGNIAFFKKT